MEVMYKADRSKHAPLVSINEYRNGIYYRTWDGITECARFYSTSVEVIMYLCATGNPLYKEQSSLITFDTPYDSPYTYSLIKDENGKKKPMLFIDVGTVMNSKS